MADETFSRRHFIDRLTISLLMATKVANFYSHLVFHSHQNSFKVSQYINKRLKSSLSTSGRSRLDVAHVQKRVGSERNECTIKYKNLFNVLTYVNPVVAKKPITSHPGNIEHSQTIMSLLTDLPYYEIKSPQNLKNTAIRLDKK